MSSSCRHPDFEKIHSAFLSHYSKDPELGEARYADWVKFSGLKESESYYAQGAVRANKSKQSFEWANFLLQFVKEDKDAFYYKVEALFPVESMNKGCPPFTREEVLQAARSLTGKPSDLNHDISKVLVGVDVVAAQFEDDCVECLVRVPKTSVLVGMIDRKEIVNVSIEGEWSHGVPGHGLVLTGLGWLTKDTMLPGIPLTRIMPVEKIAESFKGVEILEEKLIVEIAEKIAAKIVEKSSFEVEKLKIELSEAKAKLVEADGKVKVAEGACVEANGKLTVANKTVDDLEKLMPGVDLLKDPPVLMAVSEALADFKSLRLSPMVENCSGFSQHMGMDIRNKILKYETKLKAK
jgi:hypothetical protein